MENLARATPVACSRQSSTESQMNSEVNSTLSMLTDKREKGDEMVAAEASRLSVYFRSGGIKHTLVLRGGRSRGK